ncbi:MAG: hypothetical protein HY608_11720, partial [Planctomycetes bacterium]|nr:hypothetical protein [Planctomycetota bacterium]
MRAPSPRGIVLLLVTGIVTLLALLAVLFVVTTRSVSIMARTTLEGARAHLLSRAGVEYAAARLGRSLSIPAAPTAANRTDDWTFRDDPRLPLGACHNPSYAHGELFLDGGTLDGRYTPPPSPDGFDPALHDRDGSGFHSAWTGRLRGTYAPFGDTFTLRIRDANGRIDLNLPDDAGPAPGPGRFGRVMDQLGVAIAAADGVPDPIAGRGADIAARRAALPGGRFTRIEEMIGPPPGGLTDAEWAAVRPYVAVGAPVDPDVVSPLWDASGQLPGVQDPGRPPDTLASAEPAAQEALFGVSGDAEKVVGFNTAEDIEGPVIRYRNPMTRVTASVPPATARALAAAVISRRATDPFETWAEWRSWLRTLPAGITEIQADLVDAATNPNTLLNKFNPDPVALRRFDKLDVTLPTTELSLMPRGGFDVEALGLVRFDGGAVFAAANVRASLRVARTVCLTTQAHFEAAGTERVGVVTLPEPIAMPGTVPSPWDGQVVLARAADTEGADPLHVPLQTGLDALDESPVPADFPPSAETFGPSVFDTGGVGPGFFRGSQVTPLAGL